MSLSSDKLTMIINRISTDRAFAQALLDQGIDLFIQKEPEVANTMLISILPADMESVDHVDICKIMAEAKRVLGSV